MECANLEGTNAYRKARSVEGVNRKHFRKAEGLWLSSIGMGTYLGPHDDATDTLYRRAVVRAVESGCNVLDTAINYRCQRSERAVGLALKELAGKGIGREQIVVATKGGFIPFEGEPPENLHDYLEKTFYRPGILAPDDVVGGCHAMTPRYLANQLDRSLANLELETIDIYYLHNPETELSEVSRKTFMKRLKAALEWLETAVGEGKIRWYGTATWNGYRQSPKGEDYISLREILSVAEEVGGRKHHLRFIQLPYSLATPEAFANPTQEVEKGQMHSALVAADALGVTAVSSASIDHGRLTRGLPAWLGKLLKGLDSDVQRSIQFARSTPGLTTALVGMKQLKHVEENMAVAQKAPTPVEDFLKLFEVDNR